MSRKKRGKKHPRRADPGRRRPPQGPRPAHEKPKPATTCRECQATNDPDASECWLCGRRDWRGEPAFPTIQTGAETSSAARLMPVVETVLIVLALGVVGIGIVRLAPGLGIAFGVLLVPAWIITERRAAGRESPISAPRKFAEILWWSIAVPFLVAVSLPILLIVICAAVLGLTI